MALPPEIVEKILINCDGKTLLNAKQVTRDWNDIIEYLSRKKPIWKWCCLEEIPHKELIQYMDNFNNDDTNVWYKIYTNWVTWQEFDSINFETCLSPVEIPRITCIDVAGDYIAVGSDDGRIRIFNNSWRLIYLFRHRADKIYKVTFIHDGVSREINDMCFVIAYSTALIIDYIGGNGLNHLTIDDVKSHSIYKNYICYQKDGGRLTIEKLFFNSLTRVLSELWFARVYSPANITCMNMWEDVCVVLVDNVLQEINYGADNISPMSGLKKKFMLNFTLQNTMPSSIVNYQIFRDDAIVVLYKSDNLGGKEYMEVIILDSLNKYVKKLFNTWEVLQASITCVYLYGNTLVIGVDSGIVYFYHVPSWKHFDIRHYQKKIIIGKHPITNILVKEIENQRTFFVTSTFNIHEVRGFTCAY